MSRRPKAFSGRVFFDHLPKTAGTAITDWFRQSLGSGCITSRHLWGNHSDLIRRYGGNYPVISAHSHFYSGEKKDSRYTYLTVFRHPIDRALSWLYFIRNNFREDHPVLQETIRQVRAFLDSDGEELHKDLLVEISNIYTKHFHPFGPNPSADEPVDVANAFAAVEGYDIVGLYEEMPSFLDRTAQLLGCATQAPMKRLHATKARPPVEQTSDRLRQRLAQINSLDLNLYERVRSLASRPLAENLLGAQDREKFDVVPERVVHTAHITRLKGNIREGGQFQHGQMVTFELEFELTRDVTDLEIGIHVHDSERNWVFGTNSTLLGQPLTHVAAGKYRLGYHVILDLPSGPYTAGFAFADKGGGQQETLYWHGALLNFGVNRKPPVPHAGSCYLPAGMLLQSLPGVTHS